MMNKRIFLLIVAALLGGYSGSLAAPSGAKYLNEWLFDLDSTNQTLSAATNSGTDGVAFSADTIPVTQTDGRGHLICSNNTPGTNDLWSDGAVLSADVTNQSSGVRFLRYDFEYDLTATNNNSGTLLGLGFTDAGGTHLSMVALEYSSDTSPLAPGITETEVATNLPPAGNIAVIAEVNLTNQRINVWYDFSGTNDFNRPSDATGVISNLTSIEELQFRATGDFIASSSNDCVSINNIRTAATWDEIIEPIESLLNLPELSVRVTDLVGGSLSVGETTTISVVITNSGGPATDVYATLTHDAGIGLSIISSNNIPELLAAGGAITNTFQIQANNVGEYVLQAQAISDETESSVVSHPFVCQSVTYEVYSAKKGVGQAANPTVQMQKERVEALNCSWYYAWNVSGRNPIMDPAIEFVPMKSGGNTLPGNNTMTADLATLFTPEWDGFSPVTHFLGFNEPEHENQSNVTVEKALEVWPLLEEAAAANGITNIGSPSCSGANGNDGQWVTNFMAGVAANDLQVDFMAFHSYPTPTGFGMLNDAQTYYNRYGKDVWITEFNAADWQQTGNYTLAQTYTWMAELLYRLESTPYIKRYAIFPWDATWGGQAAASQVFEVGTNSVTGVTNQTAILTPLGKLYASYSSSDITGPYPGVSYYLHNKGNNERLISSGAPSTTNIYMEGVSVDFQLVSAGGNNYYILSADGSNRRLGANDTSFYWTDTATGSFAQWIMTDAGNGWHYLAHAGLGKRLGTMETSRLTLGSGAATDDEYKWAFIRSYREQEETISEKDVSTNVTVTVAPDETASAEITLINNSTNSIAYAINEISPWISYSEEIFGDFVITTSVQRVTYSPVHGVLGPQATNNITIQVDAAGQSLGTTVFTNTVAWADGATNAVVITIQVESNPLLTVTPESLSFEGVAGFVTQTNVTLRNEGNITLSYRTDHLGALTNGYAWTNTAYNWETVYQQDAFDYSFNIGADTETTTWIPLEFPFPFYGIVYTQIYISVDGEIGLANGQIIGPYLGDLVFDANADIRWYGDENHMAVTWDSLQQKNGANDLTFQAILYRNGTILFQYNKLSDADRWPNTPIGLESSGYKSAATLVRASNADYAKTVTYTTNFVVVTNGWDGDFPIVEVVGTNVVATYEETIRREALRFAPAAPLIITCSPEFGTLVPGESREITIFGNATGLMAGGTNSVEAQTTFLFSSQPPALIDLVNDEGEFDWLDTPGVYGVFQLRKREGGESVEPFPVKPKAVYTDGLLSPEESYAPELGSDFLSKGGKWSWAQASRSSWNTIYIRMPWAGEDQIDPDTRDNGFVQAEPSVSAEIHFTATNSITASYPMADADADGMADLLEWTAGTDANSADSIFAVISKQNPDGSRALSWPAPNDPLSRTYTIWYTTSLSSSWKQVVKLDNVTSYIDHDPVRNAAPVIFYRVSIP